MNGASSNFITSRGGGAAAAAAIKATTINNNYDASTAPNALVQSPEPNCMWKIASAHYLKCDV
jgi:hypothetical protein